MSGGSPLLVITDKPASDIAATLAAAGVAPVINVPPARAAAALSRSKPAAIVIDLTAEPGADLVAAIVKFRAASACFLPVIACGSGPAGIDNAILLATDASASSLAVRLCGALRVRELHAAALRRSDIRGNLVALDPTDPLADATVLVTGRGGRYPALIDATAGRTGVIAAPSLEAARSYLSARDIDGVMIGEGFNARAVDAFLDDLAADARFDDLPIVAVETGPRLEERPGMPNFERASGEPPQVLARLLPLVWMHAFSARLKRTLRAMETKGLLDPQTGLLSFDAFTTGLDRAIAEPRPRGKNLCLARMSFGDGTPPRTRTDAARIVARLLRPSDIACADHDGAILIAFNETHLNAAHVLVRRIASVIKHTALVPGRPQPGVDPSVAIAMLRATDTRELLLARIGPPAMVAAE